jgi:hypothetical protein
MKEFQSPYTIKVGSSHYLDKLHIGVRMVHWDRDGIWCKLTIGMHGKDDKVCKFHTGERTVYNGYEVRVIGIDDNKISVLYSAIQLENK